MSQRIIDAHFHLWNLDQNYYPWLSDPNWPSLVQGRAALQHNYLVADLLNDIGTLNVIAGVHIQAEHDHTDTLRETRWLQRVADDPASRGFPQAIVADTDFADPNAPALLERHADFANVRGIRHALHRQLDATPPYDPLENPTWRQNYAALARFGLSFDMQLFPRQAEAAVSLIAVNPDIQVILTHTAMPNWPDTERMNLWRRAISLYAGLPNVAIKISGFGSHSPGWTAASVAPIVDHVISAFGVERCCLASNFPVEGLATPYGEVWRNFEQAFAAYSQDERDCLFWRNAARLYRIDIEPTTGAEHQ